MNLTFCLPYALLLSSILLLGALLMFLKYCVISSGFQPLQPYSFIIFNLTNHSSKKRKISFSLRVVTLKRSWKIILKIDGSKTNSSSEVQPSFLGRVTTKLTFFPRSWSSLHFYIVLNDLVVESDLDANDRAYFEIILNFIRNKGWLRCCSTQIMNCFSCHARWRSSVMA